MPALIIIVGKVSDWPGGRLRIHSPPAPAIPAPPVAPPPVTAPAAPVRGQSAVMAIVGLAMLSGLLGRRRR